MSHPGQRVLGGAQVIGGILDAVFGAPYGGLGGGAYLIGSGAKNLAGSKSGTGQGNLGKGFLTDLVGSGASQGAAYGLGQLGGLGGGSGGGGLLGPLSSILGGGGAKSSPPPTPPPMMQTPPTPQPPPASPAGTPQLSPQQTQQLIAQLLAGQTNMVV